MAKYGKMLLSAYTMKKIISCKSKKGRGMTISVGVYPQKTQLQN